MSATTTSPVQNVPVLASDNQFKLSDTTGHTQVTLNLQRPGPLVQGSSAIGPVLQYTGTEGKFSFSGDQITLETTSLGKLYSVTLNVVPDLRTLSFTLFLPAVTHKDPSQPQSFETIGIKAEHHTSFKGNPVTPGSNPSYTVLKMHGTAAKVIVPA